MSQSNRLRGICTICAVSAASVFVFLGSGCGDGAKESTKTSDGNDTRYEVFMKEIRPIFAKKCVPCHNSGTFSGRLNLESRKTAFGGSENGSFLVPGDPKASLIYLVTAESHVASEILEKMPMTPKPLTEEERASLQKWIENGAAWPGGDNGWIKPAKAGSGEA